MTIFCLRDNLYRDTAPVPFSCIIYREKYPAVYQTCTATAPARNKICTRTAKSTPYLSCHRDNFPAKVSGPVAGWLRQVTQPPFIAGPLWAIALTMIIHPLLITNLYLKINYKTIKAQLAYNVIYNKCSLIY